MNHFSAKNGWVKLSSRDTCSSKYLCKLKRYSRFTTYITCTEGVLHWAKPVYEEVILKWREALLVPCGH